MSTRPIRQPSRALWHDSGWRGVAAAFTLNGFLFGVWASRIPSFKEEFALSQATLGFLLGAIKGPIEREIQRYLDEEFG